MRHHSLVVLILLAGLVPPASAEEPATLTGHTAPISALAFTRDGKTLLSAATDLRYDDKLKKAVASRFEGKIWNTEGKKEQATFGPYKTPIFALAVAPDQRSFASAGGDAGSFKVVTRPDGKVEVEFPPAELRLWDLPGGNGRGVVPGPRGLLRALAFRRDGLLAHGGYDGFVRYVDLATRREVKSWKAHDGEVFALAFSEDGDTLASAAHAGVALWDKDGKEKKRIAASTTLMALSADGKLVATANDFLAKEDKYAVRIWDADTGKEKGVFRGHIGFVLAVAFAPDGKHLASAGNDGALKLWDVATGKLRGDLLDGETGAVHCVVFSPDGRFLAAGSYDRSISLWETAKLKF